MNRLGDIWKISYTVGIVWSLDSQYNSPPLQNPNDLSTEHDEVIEIKSTYLSNI